MRWPWQRPAREAPAYVDTPAGIVAADGVRYRTTVALLRDYAGPVLDAVGLAVLLRLSGAWLRSPQTLAAVALPLLLVAAPWWIALTLALALYTSWAVAAPGLALPRLARVAGVLEHPVVQGLLYVGVLSALAAAGRTAEVWAGVAGFVALRLGLVDAVVRRALAPVVGGLYPLPVADQTLRAFIVRAALRRGISLPGTAEVEDRVRRFWRRDGE